MIKLKNFIDKNHQDEFSTEDFDNPKGWHWKEMDHLLEMGFSYEGDTRLKLCDKKNIDDTLNVEVYKKKSTNDYVMEMNGRKHVFNSFVTMLNKIEELGSIENDSPESNNKFGASKQLNK
jgi:hypothetical protein